MLKNYREHVAERANAGLPPLPLTAEQVAELVDLLKNPPAGEADALLELLANRIPAGVDQAAYVKAAFLADIAKGTATSPLVSPAKAVELLGTMLGGYNVQALVELLDGAMAEDAVKALSKTILMFDAFHDVAEKMKAGNPHAKKLIESWAAGEWFTNRPALPAEIRAIVFKVPGEESARLCTYERALPGGIIVSQKGERFHNEAASYHISAQEMIKAGAATAWAVFDAHFRRNYPMGPVMPKFPDWILPRAVRRILLKAPTLEALAAKMGVPPQALVRTVETFNAGARVGKDPQFGRGDAAYDRYYGDPKVTPNPNLAPLLEPPFYAFPIHSGDIGTNGGLVVDEQARVLDGAGQPIAGLYAAGNCTASVMGGSYPGAGSTLGPAMTFGWLAGRHLAGG